MKEVRPTSGKVLSALFSILCGKVEGGRFLDLFAGTGRVGLEALRRGAESCVFVESVRGRAEEIRQHAGGHTVLALEVRRAVSWLVKRDMKFDVIFADPPYGAGWSVELVKVANLAALLAEGGVLVIEHSVREPLTLPEDSGGLVIFSERDYGETRLTFLRARE